ncbi:MAG TPA: hypothetical protein VMT42_05690 [candidate division Zixibacteria bacterium]|nr:hypothetical protein [candidate division Zixibacteria bacterium]
MKRAAVLATWSFFLMFALFGDVYAANETFAEQFLGSPLLILAAVVVIAALASLYHRMRK